MPIVWEIFCEELANTIKEHNLVVHSFLLMDNHFHLIASTPDANISICMQYFMYRTSRRLTREGNRINQTFAGRHFKSILPTEFSFRNATKYNYRNPVKAGICKNVEDYPYSTLQGLLGLSTPKIPIVDTIFLEDPIEILKWFNTPSHPEKLEALRFGLKRQIFKSKKSRQDGKLIIADEELI